MGSPKKKTSSPMAMGVELNNIANEIQEKAKRIEETHNDIVEAQNSKEGRGEKQSENLSADLHENVLKRGAGRPRLEKKERLINTSITLRESEDKAIHRMVGQLMTGDMSEYRPKAVDLFRIMIKELAKKDKNELEQLFLEYKNNQ